VTSGQFASAIDAGFFLEWEEFGGYLYGTPRTAPEGDRVSLLEIDAKGARTVRGLEPSALIIALEPPSLDTLRDRMTLRGDDAGHIARRLATALDEMDLARGVADDVVANNDLRTSVAEVVDLIEVWWAERSAQG
jgi:guanylate kinase